MGLDSMSAAMLTDKKIEELIGIAGGRFYGGALQFALIGW
jgi:hypothetical protein